MIANRRKAIVPLATLLAAAAVAVGSGATFTSTTSNSTSAVTTGTLTQSNSKANAAIFNLTNVKPGDSVTGNLKITNTGTLPAAFSLTETASANAFGGTTAGSNLTLKITNTTTNVVVFDGIFGGLEDNKKNALGTVQPGVANDFTFVVTLASTADNTDQAKTASAAYQWDSVQLAGESFTQ